MSHGGFSDFLSYLAAVKVTLRMPALDAKPSLIPVPALSVLYKPPFRANFAVHRLSLELP
jgi:hypothetical protein